MKTLFGLLTFIVLFSATSAFAGYTIRSGKLQKGGNASVTVLPHSELYVVTMKYTIVKRSWVPVPEEFLKGETTIELPSMFKDERGYLELEERKVMELPDAKLRFAGRVNFGSRKDAIKIEVLPNNGRSKIQIIYHPDVASTGWANIELTLVNKIPGLNGYKLIADFVE